MAESLAPLDKKAATLRDIARWHDALISFIEADEKAREVRQDDYREAVGMLAYLAAKPYDR